MARLSSELVLTLTDRVTGPARAVGRSITVMNSTLSRIGSLAATVIPPLAGAEGMRQTVVAAADFESAMTQIQKLSGASADEVARMGEEIKAMATDGSLAVSIDEIASAYARGAAAGVPLDDLREFATLSAKGADAFGMSAEEVGNFTAKLQTALGMTSAEVREVLDLTNSLADAGISNESDIIDFVDRAGASLKTLGLAKEEYLALGSTLLNIGMTSETASTAMDALTNKLLGVNKLSGQGKKTFEKYMGSTRKFAQLVETDANDALLTMLDTLKGLSSTQRMDFLTEFVGQDHASKILRLSDAVGEYRRNLEMANDQQQWFGSLDKAYALKLDDFWSQWALAKNELNKLMIDAGNMSMPALKSGLEGARETIREIGAGLELFRAEVDMTEVEAAKVAIGDLADIIGDMLNLDASDSAIHDAFRDLAKIVNDVSAGIQKARDAAEFLTDPTGTKKAARQREERMKGMDAHPGMGRPRSSIPDDKPRRYGGSAFSMDVEKGSVAEKVIDFYSTKEKPAARAAPVPSPFAPPPEQIPAVISAISGAPPAPPAPSPAMQSALDQASARTRNFWSGAGKPDIAAPLAAEGAKAQTLAETIAAGIVQALSVTVAPIVDPGSIRAAMGDADALASKLRAIPGLAQAASDAAASARASYRQELDGLHADLSRAG